MATPVVVTFREIEKALTGAEATGNLQEAAKKDPHASPEEKAAVMAAVGHVLRQLRQAEQDAGARVLTSPHDGPASRLQSAIAAGQGANITFEPLPTGGLEAKFDTRDWFGWATVAWSKLKHLTPHPMVRPKAAVPEAIPNEAQIGILGDWGTGLYGAPEITKTVRKGTAPTVLLHLGDIYYSGTDTEVRERFLDQWPAIPGVISRALNSNHEMYSGGDAYFKTTLTRFGQEGSYFALQNTHWTLVGLDVAYKDHAIDDEQVNWLRQILAQAGERRVILFSHHQLYSHFESQGDKLWGHPGFGAILRSKRIFAWYWGHEHRCTLFEAPDERFGLYGRCIGHGGMPQSRRATRGLSEAREPRYAKGEWRRSPAQKVDGNELPACVVLEGRNPYIKDEEEKFSPHGYAVLTLSGPRLTEQILDPTGQELYKQDL